MDFQNIYRQNSTEINLICGFLSLNMIALFYAAFVHALNPQKKSAVFDERCLISSLGLTQGMLMLLDLLSTITPTETFFLMCGIQTLQVYFYVKSASQYLIKCPPISSIYPLFPAALMASFTIGAFSLRNWFPVSDLLSKTLLCQSIIILGGLLTAAMLYGNPRKVMWSKGWIQALSTISTIEQTSPLSRPIFIASHLLPCGIAIAINVYLYFVRFGNQDAISSRILAGCSSLCIPSLLIAWAMLKAQSTLNRDLAISAKLAELPALKLLKRNKNQDKSWATIVSLKTAVFTIDHDPTNSLFETMPATILQIRNEEIQRCIGEILNDKILHQYGAGQKMYGVLDPEKCARPCIEIIKLFACLYMDTLPLIEKRINGLTTLLPIVNPGLARILNSETIAELLKVNQWYFHLDYQWVDQKIISSQARTKYQVHFEPISASARKAMILHVARLHGLGSFIWIGLDAREKIIREAPMLSALIEPVSLVLPNGTESLAFIIKFEGLIPRLQRYFDLDHARNVLHDFEPSPESSKLINIFMLQSTQANSPESMINLVESVASYPWRGFKEKDQALKIVIGAQQYTSKVIAESATKGVAQPRLILKLREAIQISIERIGYPAQILHSAQMIKIGKRDLIQLLASVTTVGSSVFDESWTLLGTIDFTRHSNSDRAAVSKLFLDEQLINRILDRIEIQSKAIDTLVSLIAAEHQLVDQTMEVESGLRVLTSALVKNGAKPETLSLLFDGISLISTQLKKDFSDVLLSNRPLQRTVELCESGTGTYDTSLWNRWQEMTLNSRKAAPDAA